MLLEFKFANYKSFVEESTLSLEAAPKQKGLDYSVYTHKVGRKAYKSLRSAVIYGPNAAGKTAVIGALDTFKHIVARGNVRDGEALTSPDKAAFILSLIPNSSLAESRPTSFSIRFIEDGDLFEYGLKINLGSFMQRDFERSILSERLLLNEQVVFERTEAGVSLGDLSGIEDQLTRSFLENEQAAKAFAGEAIKDELFLTNGLKTLVSPKLSERVSTWFDRRLTVVYRADKVKTARWAEDMPDKAVFIEKTVDDAAKIFGISSNALGYMVPDGETEPRLTSLFPGADGKGGRALSAEDYESYGTVRFINLFPLVVEAIATGGVLVVDEFDASIHPMALMSIIGIFHNDDINKKGAQLIFDTHNPIFLNKNIFRRDEIKFVEREPDTGASTCYSLSDFGTSGPSAVRKNDDYMKNYFVSRYGAIEDIDFTPLFEGLASNGEDGDDGDEQKGD